MYGAYIPSSGVLSGNRVWCIDRGLNQPMGNGYDESGRSSVEAPELAYILAKWDEPATTRPIGSSYRHGNRRARTQL